MSTHVAQELKPTQRENNNNEDIDHSSMHVLPPIKNNCSLSILSPKAHTGPTLASNFRSNNHRMHTPKVFILFFSIHSHHWSYYWILFTLKKWCLWEELKRTSTHYFVPTPFNHLKFLGSLITKSSFTQVVLRGTKLMKGTKSHRMMFPELSPKNSLNKYGEPPPYKKRANNKYDTFFSQNFGHGEFSYTKHKNFKFFVYLSTFMCLFMYVFIQSSLLGTNI